MRRFSRPRRELHRARPRPGLISLADANGKLCETALQIIVCTRELTTSRYETNLTSHPFVNLPHSGNSSFSSSTNIHIEPCQTRSQTLLLPSTLPLSPFSFTSYPPHHTTESQGALSRLHGNGQMIWAKWPKKAAISLCSVEASQVISDRVRSMDASSGLEGCDNSDLVSSTGVDEADRDEP